MGWILLIVLLVMLPHAGGVWGPGHGPDGGLIVLLVLAGLFIAKRGGGPGRRHHGRRRDYRRRDAIPPASPEPATRPADGRPWPDLYPEGAQPEAPKEARRVELL